MREILFRATDLSGVNNHSWIFGSLDTTENEYTIMIYPDRFGNKCRIFVDPKTVGQYTGLTDKNGKKIFKGDILKVTDCKCKKTYTTEVCTYFNTLCVNPNGKCYEFTPIGFENAIWDSESYEVEVIGNIYDNPELLEVEK